MISKTMETILNDHIQEEIYSSYLYLSMASYAAGLNFHGFAHWMKLQSKEEWGHAMKMFDYVIERGGRSILKEIKKPPHDFKSIFNMMTTTLEHEKKVTGLINKLYDAAGKEKDPATQVMLQWFLTEQVEEEAQITDILAKMKMFPESSSAILYLDKQLAKREG